MNKCVFSKMFMYSLFFSAICLSNLSFSRNSENNSEFVGDLPYPFDFSSDSCVSGSLSFNGVWPEFPKKLMVYKVADPNITTNAGVKNFAKNTFGIPDTVMLTRSRRLGLFELNSPNEWFELDPRDGSFSFRKAIAKEQKKNEGIKAYLKESECEKYAKNHLRDMGLLEKEMSYRGTADNIESVGEMTVSFGRTINGYESWGAGARINIGLGHGGEIISIRKKWQKLLPYRQYVIKTPQEALEELNHNKGILEECKGDIKSITIRYYCSPQKQEFVQPIYFFDCRNENNESFFGVISAIKNK